MKKRSVTRQFMATIVLIFVLLVVMLTYIFSAFYSTATDDVRDLGESNLKSQGTMINNYLKKGNDVLWFAASTVDTMLKKNVPRFNIEEYLTQSTKMMQKEFDEDITGFYGYLAGGYVDGAGWTPPSDFKPKERAWYTQAIEGKGEMVLSDPYIDAQTGKTIISFTQMLSDGESVLALDVTLDEVQKIVEDTTMSDMGYCFIEDYEGGVIAHSVPSEVGKNYNGEKRLAELQAELSQRVDGTLELTIDGVKSTVFIDQIDNNWKIVIVADNDSLYEQIRTKILIGVLISVVIFAIIVGFCVYSIKRVAKAQRSEEDSLERLQRMNMNIIRSLTSTIDAKDRYTSGHSQRVADYAVRIAGRMGKSEEEQRVIFYAGLLHDVGKIRVPVEVINKPGKLTDEEFDQIRIHPVSGFHILRDIHDDERVGYAAKYHHERYDGRGYPNGLEGETIPEIARIIAVADAYDAMASDRSYRKLLPQDVVREELIKGKGTQFDPEIAEIMLQIMEEDAAYELRQTENMSQKILVVDDDPLIHTYIRENLRDMDVQVYSAATVIETFAILSDVDIDLILLDLRMPEIDGFTLYNEIRESYNIPVILVTSEKSVDTLKKIRELGIDDYVTKPMNMAVLRETIHGILQRSTAQLE
ncbi:MAG: HD domain-containing phosphohydrolase [Eubacterium sp.]|nr:HD domain-containing phosphohydrolase [Eubacterium sp.]